MNENVETLERRVSRAQTDEEKTRALNDLAWVIGNGDPQRALALSETAYELATAGGEEMNKVGAVESLMNLGRFHYQQSRLDQAQGYLEQVLALVPEVDEEHRARLEAKALMGLGLVRWRLGDYAAALRFYLDSLEIHRSSADADGEATVLNNLGLVYGVTGEYEHALGVYRQALKIYEDHGKAEGYNQALNNMAMVYLQAGEWENALAYGQRSLQGARENGNRTIQTNALDTTGAAHMELGRVEEALWHFQASAELAQDLGDKHNEVAARIHVGQAYARLQRPEEARQALRRALALAEELNDREQMRQCHHELSRLFQEAGDFQQALAHYQEYHEADRTVYSERADMRFKTLQVAHETATARKEAEIAHLRNVELEREIAERREAEAALRQTQKVESLGALAGGVAHDFNNLLVAMLGQTSLALAQMSPRDPAQKHVKKAIEAAEQAADLTQQMLAYSGRGHFEVGVLNLNELIEDNLPLLRAAVPRQVQIKCDMAPSLPAIEADADQMRQMLVNLIVNSGEALGQGGGQVRLTTDVHTLSDDGERYQQVTGRPLQPGRYVRLQVRDDGPGIAAETQAHIFDPFFTTKEQGRGLGLAAVLGIVRGHNGGLTVRSGAEGGTIFELLFPASSDAVGKGSAVSYVMGGGQVMVVDDEEMVREAVTDILSSEQIGVITAEDGAEGLEIYRRCASEISLILLDVSMPGMSGEDALRHLREYDPDVPIILSSGYSPREIEERFNSDGPTAFLQKPYTATTLVDTVKKYMPQRPQREPSLS